MKQLSFILLLTFFAILTGCVNRIDITDEEESKIFVTCEMVRGDRVVAYVSTSNNLNGSNSILFPEDAQINIFPKGIGVTENILELLYDKEHNYYISAPHIPTNDFLFPGRTYVLEARINNSVIKQIYSKAQLPVGNTIDTIIVVENEIPYNDGINDFWQGTLNIKLSEPSILNQENYFHFLLNDIMTTETIDSEGQLFFDHEGEPQNLELIRVNKGVFAVTELAHKDGFFVKYSDLIDGQLEVVLRSSIPITEENQVTKHIISHLMSISEDYYEYHIGKSNIIEISETVFSEPALLRSNIEQGIGLFSGSIQTNQTIHLDY
ncbi:MAG: DUF4249 family protein [Saprospiraceae bacterium]